MGDGAYSCCGVSLPPLEAEPEDDEHRIAIESVENEHFLTVSHPMTKEHYLSFIAWVTGDRLTLEDVPVEIPLCNEYERLFRKHITESRKRKKQPCASLRTFVFRMLYPKKG